MNTVKFVIMLRVNQYTGKILSFNLNFDNIVFFQRKTS